MRLWAMRMALAVLWKRARATSNLTFRRIREALSVRPWAGELAGGAGGLRSRLRAALTIVVAVVVAVYTAGCGMSSDPSAVARNETVMLLPALDAGNAGWCLLTLQAAELGGCPPARGGYPIIAGTLSVSGSAREAVGVELMSGVVSYVSIEGGAPLPTKAERVLPDGLRAVVWAKRGVSPQSPSFPPRPTPLNKHGQVLRQTSYGPSRSNGGSLLIEVPSNKVHDPGDPAPAPCVIKAPHLSGLVIQGARVVGTIKAYGGLIGEAFLACANTEYTLAGWPMGASILVDAAHPGVVSPPLPLMRAISGYPSVFEGPGQLGSQIARRIRGGWLVVWGGKNRVERLTSIVGSIIRLRILAF